jgi:PAS domain S-box-containing protein
MGSRRTTFEGPVHPAAGDAAGRIAGLEHALRERVKELTAVHRIAALFVADGPLDDRFATMVDCLPRAMQFPEAATAAFHHRGAVYATVGHSRSPWMLTADIATSQGTSVLEVAYQADRFAGADPFVLEERALLDSIAELVRSAIERRDAQDRLRDSLDRMDHAFEAARMGLWELDIATLKTLWSPQLTTMLGLSGSSEGTYMSRSEVIHPDDQANAMTQIGTLMTGKSVPAFELRMGTPTNWRRMSASPLLVKDEDGAPRRVIIALRDVTEQRQAEEGLRQAQKIEALGQVAAGVAHDFNNLLTILMAGSGWLMDELPEGPLREVAADLHQTSEHGAALTRQLLAFSRRAEFSPVRLGLSDLVSRLEPMLRRIAGHSVELQVKLDGIAGPVWADATQVEQAVMNLVVNARDAMANEGVIVIRTRTIVAPSHDGPVEVEHAVVEVSDSGPGIPPAVMARIFEPFFTTKESGKGTGLGLAMVGNVARSWQGRIEVDNEPGRGATFRILLPLASPPTLAP